MLSQMGGMEVLVLTEKHSGTQNAKHVSSFLQERAEQPVILSEGRELPRLVAWWPLPYPLLDPYHELVNVQNLSLWKVSHVLYKEFGHSHFFSFIVHMRLSYLSLEKFSPTYGALDYAYLGSDASSLNQQQLLSHAEPNCLLASWMAALWPWSQRYHTSITSLLKGGHLLNTETRLVHPILSL